MKNRSKYKGYHFIGVAIGVGILYSIIEAGVHTFVLHEGTFVQQLFAPEAHELWMRLLALVLFIPFGVYGYVISAQCNQATEMLAQAHARDRTVLNTSMDGFLMVRADGSIGDCNEAYCQLVGYSPEELLSLKITDLEVVESAEETAAHIQRVMQTGSNRFESTHRRKDGSMVDLEISATFVELPEDCFFVSFARDITERKQAQEVLRENQERFRALAESTSDWIWEVNENAVYTYASPKVKDLLGYEPEEVIGKTPFDLMPPAEAKRVAGLFADVVKSRETFADLENINVHKDGRHVVLETSGVPILDEAGNLLGYRGIDRDITERKRAEEQLRERVKELNCLYGISRAVESLSEGSLEEMLQEIVNILPSSWQYGDIACARIAVDRKQYTTTNWQDVEPRQSADIWVHGEVCGAVEVCYLADRPEADEGAFLREERKLIEAVGERVGRIIERKRAEEEIRRSEEFSSSLVTHSSYPTMAINPDTSIRYVNPTLEKATGFSSADLVGSKAPYPFWTEETLAQTGRDLAAAMQQGAQRFEELFQTKDGQQFWVEITSVPIQGDGELDYYFANWVDITERKRAEEAVRRHEQSLRSLAVELVRTEERERRRIAITVHDNLGQILALSKMKLGQARQLAPSPDLAAAVGEIQELMDQAIEYARSLAFELSPPVLHELGFQAAVEWLADQVEKRHGIMVHFSRDEQLKLSDEDMRVTFFQALRELLNNVAKHAHARTVEVCARKKEGIIWLQVEDDGDGFDVTKLNLATGEGGGFGLFNVCERLKYMGGSMEIESQPGQGTRVTLSAPLGLDKSAAD